MRGHGVRLQGCAGGVINQTAEIVIDVCVVLLVVAMRLLSVKFNLMLPGAVERHQPYLPGGRR